MYLRYKRGLLSQINGESDREYMIAIHTKNREQLGNEVDREYLQYKVGPLLYTPALHKTIAEDICSRKHDGLKSIALCLEDAIGDSSVEMAEDQVIRTIIKLNEAISTGDISRHEMPLVFIRIRTPQQMEKLYPRLQDTCSVVTGFILPKFDLSNVESYKDIIEKMNSTRSGSKLYIMPILESTSIIDIETRSSTLTKLKASLESIRPYVLNIRVGGNDFCNKFGLRRNWHQTIHDITVVKNALADIMNVFGRDYIVSAPVWEYFDNKANDEWSKGLKREIELDQLNGFIGKTAIHPSQLPIILESMKVDYADYRDADSILNWENHQLGVAKSEGGTRMNEAKVHTNWAKKILILAEIYGVKNDEESYRK